MDEPSPWLSIGDAAKAVGVSASAVHKAVTRGALEPRIVSRGGLRLLHCEDVARWSVARHQPRRPRGAQ